MRGSIVFLGSSSIRLWNTLATDFPGRAVVNCGFGGSTLRDWIYYGPELITLFEPDAIVMYCGENDLARGEKPEVVFADFQRFYQMLRAAFPAVTLAYISVKLSPNEVFVTSAQWWMFDKWELGPARVLNFAAIAWLFVLTSPWLERIEPHLHWFSLIGRHMLPVFCTQIAFSLLLNGVSQNLRDDPPEIAVWLTLQVACAFGLALALEGRKPFQPAPPPTPARAARRNSDDASTRSARNFASDADPPTQPDPRPTHGSALRAQAHGWPAGASALDAHGHELHGREAVLPRA